MPRGARSQVLGYPTCHVSRYDFCSAPETLVPKQNLYRTASQNQKLNLQHFLAFHLSIQPIQLDKQLCLKDGFALVTY